LIAPAQSNPLAQSSILKAKQHQSHLQSLKRRKLLDPPPVQFEEQSAVPPTPNLSDALFQKQKNKRKQRIQFEDLDFQTCSMADIVKLDSFKNKPEQLVTDLSFLNKFFVVEGCLMEESLVSLKDFYAHKALASTESLNASRVSDSQRVGMRLEMISEAPIESFLDIGPLTRQVTPLSIKESKGVLWKYK